MTTPLALVCYDALLPGSQLVNRLQDLGYRVQAFNDLRALVTQARQTKPMVILVDLIPSSTAVCATIRELKRDAETRHIPVVAFGDVESEGVAASATDAGATLVAASGAVLEQLPVLLEQALRVE